MIELRTLGVLEVRDPDGRELQPVLAQPKRLALLVYLALARPRHFHRRDTIVALFWPELDQDHARGALRVALRFLRRELGESVLISRTEEELGVNAEALRCDALRFEQACEAGQFEEALALYGGDFLEGLFIADASPELERWMDTERARLRTHAARAAWQLTERHFDQGNPSLAAGWARRAAELSPDDEEAQRRLITLLDRVGDRAGAVHAYEAFARRLAEDHEVEPSPETQALIRAIRSRADSLLPRAPPTPRAPVGPSEPAGRDALTSSMSAAPRWRMPATAAAAVSLVLFAALIFGLNLGGLRNHLLHRGSSATDTPHLPSAPAEAGAAGPRGSLAPKPNSVAVLYFENLSRDTNDAYLADGLTEDIITRLGRLPQLEVASRYLVRRHRQGPAGPAQLGDTLGVAHLLSGTVRHSGRTLRVTAELISTSDVRRLWGDEYDRPDTNLLAIQSEIAGAVARAIGGRLAPTQQASLRERPTRDPGAYDHYLKGNFLLAERNPRALARAVNEYSATLRADPQFSGALARMAYTYAVCLTWDSSCDLQRGDVPRDTLLARGLAAADRALRLDPRSSDAWMARGYLLTNGETAAPREALADFGRALGLDSTNAEAWHQYGATLELFGRGSAAVVAYRRALALDPDRPITWFDLGWLYLNRREFHTAIRLFDSALVVDPTAGYVHGQRGRARLFAGDTTDALRDLEESPRVEPWSRLFTVLRLAAVHDTAGLGRSVADLLPDTPNGQMVEVLVLVLAGQRERAIQTLRRVAQPGGRTLWWLAAPELDPIAHDARVRRLYEESRRLTGPLEGPRR